MKVGVIGLGTMGMGAALNLVRKGHQVTGCDVRDVALAELTAAANATPDAQAACAKQIIASLAKQAYRRPVTAEDVNELLA